MKVIIYSVGVNPEKIGIIIKEMKEADTEYAELIIKQINDGKEFSFDCLSDDDAMNLADRLTDAGAGVGIEEDTVLDKFFNKLSKPLEKIIDLHAVFYKKYKIPAIALFIVEAILAVVLLYKYWAVLFSLVLVIGIVEIYTNKKDHTDVEREDMTKMFKQMGKWLAIIVAVIVLINFIADRYNPTAVVRNSYFENFSTDITIGEAFDKGFDRGEWEEFKENGTQYVRFTGYYVSYTTSDGTEFGNTCQIDFIVDGGTYDIAQVYADGVPAGSLSQLILSGILTSVYERNGLSY